MGQPLFTAEETAAYDAKKAEIDKEYNTIRDKYWTDKTVYPKDEFDKNSEKSRSLSASRKVLTVRRAQVRAEEFLNALLILVGSRGVAYVDFDDAFEKSDSEEVKQALQEYETTKARRDLHTILKALTEIPKSWATSAFIRFLRGTGKQKGLTYHGAGTFGPLFGWKEDEVRRIAQEVTGARDYGFSFANVLMHYEDVQDEIYDAQNATEDGYEEVPYGTEFVATRVERDVVFLNRLCEILKTRGLADIAAPAEKKAPKPRKVKQFEAGDIIKATAIRDLPLPAHVRVAIKKRKRVTLEERNKGVPVPDATEGTIDLVITQLYDGTGHVNALMVKPKAKKAYPYSMGKYYDRKDLEGATFLGKWTGEILKTKELKVDFDWWPKTKGY